jgi:branched-chain amino acid transport system substrate-binding protein
LLISLASVAIDQARAQVEIGALTDLSSVYPDISGKGSVSAGEMAADDFGPVLGKPVEVVSANHENSPDMAIAIARRWYDIEGVDMRTDGGPSPVALTLEDLSRTRSEQTPPVLQRPKGLFTRHGCDDFR